MWPNRLAQKKSISDALDLHSKSIRYLPGIDDPDARSALSWQIVASIRREDYFRAVQQKSISTSRANPNDLSFDAERAVTFHLQNGNIDEASWLIFLMTHFARPSDTGWLRLRQVYGKLGAGTWDFATVSQNPAQFITWLDANWQNIGGKFGNHRKYESLDPSSNRNMGRVLRSYLKWVGPAGHQAKFSGAVHQAGNDPHVIFDVLFKGLDVFSFGRLAKFDYLSLIGRYSIAPASAGSAYLKGATGPARGARLLFDGSVTGKSSVQQLQSMLDELDNSLHVGMAVLEDSLCNWQKSPGKFIHFTG